VCWSSLASLSKFQGNGCTVTSQGRAWILGPSAPDQRDEVMRHRHRHRDARGVCLHTEGRRVSILHIPGNRRCPCPLCGYGVTFLFLLQSNSCQSKENPTHNQEDVLIVYICICTLSWAQLWAEHHNRDAGCRALSHA
jgi:hypothetical protein